MPQPVAAKILATRLKEWLASTDCHGRLVRLAHKRCLQNMPVGSDLKECIDDIVSKLWEQLLERSNALTEDPTILGMIENRKWGPLLGIALRRIAWREADRTRNPYYRHLVQVLRETPEAMVRPLPQRQGSEFAYATDALDWPAGGVNEERFAPPPVNSLDIHKNFGIRMLARHFWDEACRVLGAPHWVHFRALLRYAGMHYADVLRPMQVDVEGGEEDERDLDGMAGFPDPRLGTEALVIRALADPQKIAQGLVAPWSDKLRCAFYLRVCQKKTLKQVALILGYKEASGAKYPVDALHKWMREFLSKYSDLGVEDLDDELFGAVITCAGNLCKPACP
jgi:hypothetical protein